MNTALFVGLWGAVLPLLLSSPAKCQDLIRYEYGSTLVLQEIQGGPVYVVCGHADPIMFSSRANFSVWKFHSMNLLNQYLDAQRERRSKPENIDETLLKLVTVTLEGQDFRSDLPAFGLRLGWLPGGAESCQLEWHNDNDIRIGLLRQNIRIPRFGRSHMSSVSEYNRKLKKL